MNKNNPQPIVSKFEYMYDVTSNNGMKQGQAVLIALVETFKDHLQSKRMDIKSEERHGMQIITVLLSRSLRYDIIKDIADAINTAAYYATDANRVGEFFVAWAEVSDTVTEG